MNRKSSVGRTLSERMKDSKDLMGEEDNKSVYSVDPKMYEKLGVRRPRKGEEQNNYDAQKVIRISLLRMRMVFD